MNINPEISNLNKDIIFLTKNEANRFAHVSINEVIQLLQRKKLYKQSSGTCQEYQNFKEKMSRLKMAKLPFRIVEIVNASWKLGSNSIPHNIAINIHVSKPLDNTERKEQKRELRETLITQAASYQEALRIVEQINFLHGTNSSLLPMIHDSLEMIPTGRLLDKGKAPMCGEIGPGMNEYGINQHSLSAETVRDISRCWNYASRISNSFNPKAYSQPENLFLETLENLNKTSLGDSDWDRHIITLLQLKQWNPDAFTQLCKKYRKEIEHCKGTAKGRCLNKKEQMVQKAIDYDMDRLIEAKKTEEIPQYLKDDFPDIWGRKDMQNTWKDELHWNNPLSETLSTKSFAYLMAYDSNPGRQLLLLRLFAKESFLEIQTEARDSTQPLEDTKYYMNQERKIKKICFGDENREFTDADYPLIFQKLVVDEMEACIKRKMSFYQRRYDRLINAFDTEPTIRFSKQDREMIEKPFAILLASTKAKASEFVTNQEINFSSAKLGEEIDLAFVSAENMEKMNQWIKDHNLEGKVKVFDSNLVTTLNSFPLYHAPDQVQNTSYLFDKGEAKQLNDVLNKSVFPLYRVTYPDGGSRFWHGVPHSVRTVLFAQVLMEICHEKGIKLEHSKLGLLLSMALHDVARENDGKDFWDAESGQMAKQILMKELQLSEEEASFFAACVADKDKAPTSNEQRIIHDGDCIEIIRCLRDPSEFKLDELRMKGILPEESIVELIQEAKLLIQLTDQGVIKSFLENSKSPYQALLQIINQSFKDYGKFGKILHNVNPTIKALSESNDYQLTSEVESAIKAGIKK